MRRPMMQCVYSSPLIHRLLSRAQRDRLRQNRQPELGDCQRRSRRERLDGRLLPYRAMKTCTPNSEIRSIKAVGSGSSRPRSMARLRDPQPSHRRRVPGRAVRGSQGRRCRLRQCALHAHQRVDLHWRVRFGVLRLAALAARRLMYYMAREFSTGGDAVRMRAWDDL